MKLNSQELAEILGCVNHTLSNELYEKLLKMRDLEMSFEKHQLEQERIRREAIPEMVNDFSKVRAGTLVRRSVHYYESRSLEIPEVRQLGIIVDISIKEDFYAGVSYWPVIHWESQAMSSLTHPNLVDLSSGEVLKQVKNNANQQVSDKTPSS